MEESDDRIMAKNRSSFPRKISGGSDGGGGRHFRDIKRVSVSSVPFRALLQLQPDTGVNKIEQRL